VTKPQRRLWGVTVARILDLLEHTGPMTSAEACKLLGLERKNSAAIFSRLMRPVVKPEPGPRRIHVCGYTHDEEGQRDYPRAIYALGDKPDARKPVSKPKEIAKRYRVNLKKRQMVSVFNLGDLQ